LEILGHVLGSLLTLGTATIHFAGALGQPVAATLREQVLLGCVAIQTAAGVALLIKPNRAALVLAAVLNAAGVFIWIAVRSIGLRVGADIWRPATLGVPDYYLPAMQLFAAMVCVSARLCHFDIMRYLPIGLAGLVVLGGVIARTRERCLRPRSATPGRGRTVLQWVGLDDRS